MNPLTALPDKARKTIYAVYAAIGVTFGGIQVGYATAGIDQPTWLLVAFGVFAYLGTALGLVAAANVSPSTVVHRFESLSADNISSGGIVGAIDVGVIHADDLADPGE